MFERLFRLTSRPSPRLNPRSRRRSRWLEVDLLERRDLLTQFTPGNLVILQAGDGMTGYLNQAPLFINEITTGGASVQQVSIPATGGVGKSGNQPITIDLGAAAGNGQFTRSYDGSALTFGGVDSTINNGGLTSPATPTGQNDRVIGVLTGDPATASNLDTTTHGQFYVGDDNRGGVAESPSGPIYTAGHPNQAGGAVSQGVHYFPTEGPSIGTQVSATTNVRGVNIGFDNRMYFSTAGGLGGLDGNGGTTLNTAGIFTDAKALPTDANANPANDIQVVPALFTASKLGGLFLADMNGDGIVDNGDRLYFLDDGTVGGAGTGGLYVATWNDAITANLWNTGGAKPNPAAVAAGLTNHWSVPVRLGDAPTQSGSGNVGQLRGVAGTVLSPTEADIYTSAFDDAANDNSYIQQWDDTNSGVAIARAEITSGTTVKITTLTPFSFADGSTVEVDGVGSTTGSAALSSGYNGSWTIHVIDSTHFTYNDTNSGASSLQPVTNQGATDVTLNGTIIQTLAGGSVTNGNKTFAMVGLRGVSFAPVAATSVSLAVSKTDGSNSGSSLTIPPGTNVKFTATLTNSQVGAAGLNGDTVTFIDQNTQTVIGQGTASTTGGVTTASFTTSTPLVGNHVVTAYFAGGGLKALASANSNTVSVIEAGSTSSSTSVVSNLPNVATGKQVTLTATVTTGATGTVSFYNGSVSLANLLGTTTLNNSNPDVATLPAVFSTAGAQTIIAVYNGDNTYASSQGQTVINVAPNATATITSSANNVAVGSTQTYTANIIGNGVLGTPGGSVVFTITSATTNSSGNPVVVASSSAIALTGNGVSASAQWTGPALTAAGSYFVTISYTATGSTNPYSSFQVNTSSSTNGTAFIETAKQAFTPGNLIAVQRGDGTVNLGSNGYLVFLDEYTTSGTLVQAIAMPNLDAGTGASSAHGLLLSGQNGTEGLLQRSGNGYYLTIAGYDLPVGRTFVTSTFPYQFPRTIARIDLSGNLNTSTAISTTQASGVLVPYNPLDVVTNDGSQFWLASDLPNGDTTDSGILYVGSVGATTATQIGPANKDAASIFISGGQLYVAKGFGDVQAVGTGLPTTSGQTLTGLPNLAAAYAHWFPNAANPEQVLLLNTNDGTTNNPNVAYIADAANGLLKFWFDGTSWYYGKGTGSGPDAGFGSGVFGQKFVSAGGVVGVTGFVVNPGPNAQVQLYVTGSNVQQQNPNQLDSFLDKNAGTAGGSTGFDQGFTSGNFNIVSRVGGSNPASPNGNMNFAGVAFAPGYTTQSTLKDSGPGASNTFTATVTSLGGNVPTGVVIFSVDGAVFGQSTLNGSGVATLTDSSFPTDGKSHVITAAYQGDVKDGTSTGTLTQAAATFTPGNLLVTQVGTVATATINNITESGTTATVNTVAAHGFVVGQLVAITGSSVSGYNNKTYTILTVPSSTSFTATATSGLGSSSGGTVTLNLNGTATSTAVVEYTNPGSGGSSLVQTVSLPTAGPGAVNEGGTTTTQGYLTNSADGHSAEIAGYNAAIAGSITSANGTVGVVNPNGSVESSTQIPAANTGGAVRAVASADGQGMWVATGGNFLQYVPFGNSNFTATTTVSNFFPSPSAVEIGPGNPSGSSAIPGQLFVDGGAGAQSNGVPAIDGPASINDPGSHPGLPTNAGNTGIVLGGFPTSSTPNGFPTSNQFAISPDGNTIFVADSRTNAGGGILEFFQSTPGSWLNVNSGQTGFPIGTAGADSGLRGLVVDFTNPAAPVIYGTTTATSGNRIVKITGGSTNGSTPGYSVTTLATAPANTAFRGVALAPTNPGTTATTTTLSVSGSPGTYPSSVTMTATVTNGATGWVSFQQNGIEIGAAPLVGNTATFAPGGNFFAGTYSGTLTAVYTGDGTFAPSTSTAQSATVTKFTPNVQLTTSFSKVAAGVADTLTATVGVPAGTAPTGTVTFWDGQVGSGINLGTVSASQVIVNQSGNPVITFTAVLTTTFTTVGQHPLNAVYNGDQNFGTATGQNSVQVVNSTTTTVTTSSAAPTATPSVTLTVTATVTSAGAGTISGSVQFYDNLLPIGSPVNISGNNTGGAQGTNTVTTALVQSASGTADVLTPGQHSISAVYTPDSAASNSYFTSTGVYQQTVTGQAFGRSDTFVYRVGDGTTGLIAPTGNPNANTAAIGSTIFVDEYNPAASPGTGLVQSIALPTADSQSFAISAATQSGNTVTVTTAAPHNFAVGDVVAIAGVLLTGYNGTITVASVPNSTSFTYTLATSGLSASTGGTATGNVRAVVGNGQQSATGQMSLSGDGQFLFVSGYDNSMNGSDASQKGAPAIPTGPGSASIPRAVARIKYDGSITTAAFSGVQTGGNFNGVWSPDGNQLYLSGFNGVQYIASFGPSASLQTVTSTITSTGFTVAGLEGFAGNLYEIGGTPNLIQNYKSPGFPTSTATLNPLTGVNTTTDANQSFVIDAYFAHLNGTNTPAGINTMYLSDDGTGFAHGLITKWALVSGTWTLVDHITAGTGNSAISVYWLSGQTDASGNVTLYSTYGNGGNSDTGPGQLLQVIDTNGYNAPIGSGGTHSDNVNILAEVGSNGTAGLSSTNNEVFRGVAATPLPAVASVTMNANTFPILTASESNTTVTINTSGPQGFVTGESVVIAGMPTGYNGHFLVTVVNATSFTYTAQSGLNPVTAGNGGTATSAQAATAGILTAQETSGTTATITTTAAHGFTLGQIVTVTGVNVPDYNGTFTILSTPSSTTFTYAIANSGVGNGSGGSASLNSPLAGVQRSMVDSLTYKFSNPVTLGANAFTISVHQTGSISTATESGTTVTITTPTSHFLNVGQTVVIAGVSDSGYNGSYTITGVPSPTTFTYTAASGLSTNATGGTYGPGIAPSTVYDTPDGGFTWIVTFIDPTNNSVIGNSIANGVYDITLNQSAVTYNNSGATLTQSNRTLDTFYRLYGDVLGAKRVNIASANLFNAAFNSRSTAANYNAAFDWNNDGRINITDANQFNADFNERFNGFTPTI